MRASVREHGPDIVKTGGTTGITIYLILEATFAAHDGAARKPVIPTLGSGEFFRGISFRSGSPPQCCGKQRQYAAKNLLFRLWKTHALSP